MKNLLFIIVLFTFSSCNNKETKPVLCAQKANCALCHSTIQTPWANVTDLHTISKVNGINVEYKNTKELYKLFCLKCHVSFQSYLNSATSNKTINPNHSVNNKTNSNSLINNHSKAGKKNISNLPAAYQKLISSSGDTSTYIYPDQTSFAVKVTKLCNSCHNPKDQGSKPSIKKNGIDFGPQGGKSRVYVMENHKGFGCGDCHNPSNFLPFEPSTKSSCNSCHPTPDSQTGKVHINHLSE